MHQPAPCTMTYLSEPRYTVCVALRISSMPYSVAAEHSDHSSMSVWRARSPVISRIRPIFLISFPYNLNF